MNGFPHIFSFYSFKGGVGRSMALLNVAYTLASRGRHVLIMDLDLEAPGLSGFLHREHELGQSAPEDIVDLLAWARRAAATLSDEKPQLAPSELPGGAQFITSVRPEKLASLKPRLGDVGHLDVISANTDPSYYDRFTNLQLGTLQQTEIVAMGRLLRAWLKRLTLPIEVPDYYGPDVPRSVPYDYVLIDSRTGISEIGGLCIGPLSDRLVVLTALNDQNIEGTKRFLQEVGINKPRTSEDPLWDEVDVRPSTTVAPPRMGPKPTLLVASPVPAGGLVEKRQRLEVLDKQIGPIASKISYHPQLALHETIFVRDWTDEYLAAEYSGLADHLMAMVADHGRQNLEVSPEMFDGKVGSPENIIRAAMHLPDLATNLLEFWSRHAKPSTTAEFVSADRVFRILTGDKPSSNHAAFNNWGNALSDQARTKQGAEADQLFHLAGEKYEAALRIKPNTYEPFHNWGNTLLAQAKMKQGAEADQLFQLAAEKYDAALRIKPDMHEAFNAWCTALIHQAYTKEDPEKRQLLQTAHEKCASAEKLSPGSGAYNLACISALQGRADDCRTWLQTAKTHGKLPKKSHLLNDTDLTSVRDLDWFTSFLGD